jgi:predicted outer membrane repeat protein
MGVLVKTKSIAMLAGIAVSTTALGADLTVGSSGQYVAINEAMVDAEPGDRLLLDAEVFVTNLAFYSVDITVEGAGIGQTVLQSDGNLDRFLWIEEASVVFRSLTIDGDSVSKAIYANNSTIELDQVSIVNSVDATGSGGGSIRMIDGSDVVMTGVDLTSATSSAQGGHVYAAGGSISLDDTQMANGSAGSGGAIYADGTSIVANDTAFVGNSASSEGGVIYTNDDLELSNTTIATTDTETGAHVYSAGADALTWTGVGVLDSVDGEVLYADSTSVLLHSVDLGEGETGLEVTDSEDVTISYLTACRPASPVVTVARSSVSMHNVAIAEPQGNDVDAVTFFDPIDATLAHSSFVGDVTQNGGAVRVDASSVQVEASHLVVVGFQGDAALIAEPVDKLVVSTSLFQDNWWDYLGTDGGGIIQGDPNFQDWSGDCDAYNLSPQYFSPAVDVGPTLDPDDSQSDMGFDAGPDADSSSFLDGDLDTFIAKFDCDDDDSGVTPHDCDGDCDGTPESTYQSYYVDADADGYGVGSELEMCAAPGFAPLPGDCDDDESWRNPGSQEDCDGVDEDCDGLIDDGLLWTAWYFDGDLDGYGTGAGVSACGPDTTDPRYARVGFDCDDTNADINPAAAEDCQTPGDENCNGLDEDCEGIDEDGDGYCPGIVCTDGSVPGDCDDTDNSIAPLLPEQPCNGVDDDCDGAIDDEWTVDVDGDGHSKVGACSGSGDDCDDENAWVYPGADELCNDIDDDCSGSADDGLAIDDDNDGFPGSGCLGDADVDCDDSNDEVYPNAPESPTNGVDDNCNGVVDESGPDSVDNDGDGYCAGSSCVDGSSPGDCDDTDASASPASWEVLDGLDNDCNGVVDDLPIVDSDNDGVTAADGDCDDEDASVHPNADELCNGRDDDCDGFLSDEEADRDQDGQAECAGDCDDTNLNVWLGRTENCGDGIDNNCDGTIDADADLDEDGYTTCRGDCVDDDASVFPHAVELCDGLDNDCDGLTDEGLDADADGFKTCVACTTDDCDCDDFNRLVRPGRPETCGDGLDNDCSGAIDDDVDEDMDSWTRCEGDCNDANPADSPSAPERCDGRDNDCDGTVDETYDVDGDGVVLCFGDCDDRAATVNVHAPELCDDLDNDCNRVVDDAWPDLDGDGATECNGDCAEGDADVGPHASEQCSDGVDNDCDELVDAEDEACDQSAGGARGTAYSPWFCQSAGGSSTPMWVFPGVLMLGLRRRHRLTTC